MITYEELCQIVSDKEDKEKKQHQRLISLINNYVSVISHSLGMPAEKIDAAIYNNRPYVFATYEENGQFFRVSQKLIPPALIENGVSKIKFQVSIVLEFNPGKTKTVTIPCVAQVDDDDVRKISVGDIQNFIVDNQLSSMDEAAEFFKVLVRMQLT